MSSSSVDATASTLSWVALPARVTHTSSHALMSMFSIESSLSSTWSLPAPNIRACTPSASSRSTSCSSGDCPSAISRSNPAIVPASASTEPLVAIITEAGYYGAGTCEFLVGVDGTISFLEVNHQLGPVLAPPGELLTLQTVADVAVYLPKQFSVHAHRATTFSPSSDSANKRVARNSRDRPSRPVPFSPASRRCNAR